jgi:hypothetical protein
VVGPKGKSASSFCEIDRDSSNSIPWKAFVLQLVDAYSTSLHGQGPVTQSPGFPFAHVRCGLLSDRGSCFPPWFLPRNCLLPASQATETRRDGTAEPDGPDLRLVAVRSCAASPHRSCAALRFPAGHRPAHVFLLLPSYVSPPCLCQPLKSKQLRNSHVGSR